jgi:uncharacterized protein with HEPN domain
MAPVSIRVGSEASRSIPDDLKVLSPHIPWRKIAGIGNLLRHEYQHVEPLIIWNIVKRYLGELDGAVSQLLLHLDEAKKA